MSTAPIRALTCLNTDKPEKASVDPGLVSSGESTTSAACTMKRYFTTFEILNRPPPTVTFTVFVNVSSALGCLISAIQAFSGPAGARLYRGIRHDEPEVAKARARQLGPRAR